MEIGANMKMSVKLTRNAQMGMGSALTLAEQPSLENNASVIQDFMEKNALRETEFDFRMQISRWI